MRLILPVPPSVNHCYGRTKFGVYKTAEAKAWQQEAGYRAKAWWKSQPIDTKLVLNIWVWWPNKRRRDLDNICKLALDALTGIVWTDDHLVLPRFQDYAVDKENPRIELEVLECEDI